MKHPSTQPKSSELKAQPRPISPRANCRVINGPAPVMMAMSNPNRRPPNAAVQPRKATYRKLIGAGTQPPPRLLKSAHVFLRGGGGGAEGGHPPPPPDIDHLALCRLDMKVSKWANARDHVARFQMKNKA